VYTTLAEAINIVLAPVDSLVCKWLNVITEEALEEE
jgi:hypothetical protein